MASKRSTKTVLVIVGMPGAGKSLASKVASRRGMPVFVSGDIIRAEAKRLGFRLNKQNLGKLMLKIRKEEGMGAVAKRLKPLIEKREESHVVYEGARNIEEVDELARNYKVVIVAVHASQSTRFERLLKRRRGDRPGGLADFSERDKRELGVGVGKVIALADRMVENEGSKEDLRRRMRRLLKKILAQSRFESSRKPRSGLLRTQ